MSEACRTGRSEGGTAKKVIESYSGLEQDNQVGYINTLLEYYLHINPNELSDEEWAEKLAQLNNIRDRESKANK